MKTVYLNYPLHIDEKSKLQVLATGFFDGVHLGHQKVIKEAKKLAEQKGLPLGVVTYDHHPALVYKRLEGADKQYLTPLPEKLKLLERMGVDNVYVINYDFAFQAQTPQEFVDNYLEKLNPETVVAGFDHTYGAEHATMDDLPGYAQGRFAVKSVSPFEFDGEKVGSSRIRSELNLGNIGNVNEMLGRLFTVDGVVVHGFARGRTMGYPTANIEGDSRKRLPGLGVYIVDVLVNGDWHHGMASLGKNETFGDDNPVTLEVNILDFDENIYGNFVKVRWFAKLRNSVKFKGQNELVDQLKVDEEQTRAYFEKADKN